MAPKKPLERELNFNDDVAGAEARAPGRLGGPTIVIV